jgi:hypothetical protein
MCGGTLNFKWLLCKFTEVIDVVIGVIFALALVVIIWQIINIWIIHGGDSAYRKEGPKILVFAFATLVVMSALWGIVNLLRSSII